jgi:hypothetical protein
MCLDSSWRLRQARGSRTGCDCRRRQCLGQATAVLPVSWSAMVPALASAHTAAAARWVSVRPLADFQRRCQNGTLAGGGDPNRTKQKKWACGKSGEKESGFARPLRCRPAESDLARSARKSKKSYWAPGPPFQDVGRSHALSGDARTPGARAGSFHELGTRYASSPGTSQSPGAAEQRAGPRGV